MSLVLLIEIREAAVGMHIEYPETCAGVDHEPEHTVHTRLRLLEQVAREGTLSSRWRSTKALHDVQPTRAALELRQGDAYQMLCDQSR